MIEVKNLTKRYERGEALNGIDFKVQMGEICAVAGKDGSGKTTLADLLGGCMEPDGGQILVCGADMIERASEARQHMGYAAAKPSLYLDMTPRAGMKFIADARGIGGREASDKIDAAIKRFGLKDVADTRMSSLSMGVRKLVAIAQATFAGAEVIVIDEPTEGLDPKEILEVREAVRGLKKDHAVLLTSKSMTELCEVADRVLMLADGKVAVESTPENLHRMTMNDGTLHLIVRGEESAVRAAMKSVAEIRDMSAEDGGAWAVVLAPKKGEDLREAAFRAVCDKGLVLLEMKPGVKPIDDLLMELTSERTVHEQVKEEQGDESDI